jgi:xanthine dehydrogenase molybdenum-binding subunit
MAEYKYIGKRVKRKDARSKVTGEAKYAEDMFLQGMLCGKVLRSKYPHALIKKIDTSKAKALEGVVCVLTAEDVKGTNRYGLAVNDQEVLVEKKARYCGDAIASVAAETEEIALKALSLIDVEYEVLPVVSTIEGALREDAPLVHERLESNIVQKTKVRKGDVESGFQESDIILEKTFTTQCVEHAYLERECSVATTDVDGNLTVWEPCQYPVRSRRQISKALGLSFNRVRVIQSTTGGAFGSKDDITTSIHAAHLSFACKRPVKYAMSREESLYTSSKRHPFIMKCKLGADKNGKLLAMEADIYGDTGAYTSLGVFVVKKAGLHISGPYEIPSVKADTYTVYTNNVMSGAFRGFGVPQAHVAIEVLMDILAEKVGMSAVDLRLKNCLRAKTTTTATNHCIQHSVGIDQTLEKVKPYYDEWKSQGGTL